VVVVIFAATGVSFIAGLRGEGCKLIHGDVKSSDSERFCNGYFVTYFFMTHVATQPG
jgi:hypothetical protein